jgi:hypothetical protein
MFGKQWHVFVYNKTRETFLAFKVKVADGQTVVYGSALRTHHWNAFLFRPRAY